VGVPSPPCTYPTPVRAVRKGAISATRMRYRFPLATHLVRPMSPGDQPAARRPMDVRIAQVFVIHVPNPIAGSCKRKRKRKEKQQQLEHFLYQLITRRILFAKMSAQQQKTGFLNWAYVLTGIAVPDFVELGADSVARSRSRRDRSGRDRCR
jgi:hypothetical protein